MNQEYSNAGLSPSDPYYIRPDLFVTKKANIPTQKEVRFCFHCKKSFLATWISGAGPRSCSQKCINARMVVQNREWRKKNPKKWAQMMERHMDKRRTKALRRPYAKKDYTKF